VTWWDTTGVAGRVSPLRVRSRALRADVDVAIWAPTAAAAEALPLLVAHDGPEYDRVSRLTRFSAVMIAQGRLPPHRVALLPAAERAEWYSASARYARALADELLPAVRASIGVVGAPAGLGASLGALALLHAERRAPGTFAALCLQSGSFFTRRLDPQESGFARFARIARAVAALTHAPAPPDAPRLVLTCGAGEENLPNNRALVGALARRGWPVELHEVAGMHDHVAWRDALHPHLTRLLARTWRPEDTVRPWSTRT
jgi:enterochelin esterase-like enzyme